MASFTAAGKGYKLRVGKLESVPFDIGPDVYKKLKYDALAFFYLQRSEVSDALIDLRLAWAAGSTGRGPGYWPPIVAERKRIMDAVRAWSPPPALGAVPEAITEPLTIMLWGITTERVHEWAAAESYGGGSLSGFCAASSVSSCR